MPKPRYWWYYTVKQIATRSLRGQIAAESMAGCFINSCVKSAYERTRKRKDGKSRCQAVDQLLTKGGYKSVGGVAMQLHVAERVVVRYISDFVYDVAEEMGFYHGSES